MRILLMALSLMGFLAVPALAAEDGVLSPPEALAQVQSGARTLFDVRAPDEWASVGVPQGAQTVDLEGYGGANGFVAEVLKRLNGDKTKPVAVICRTGHRSTLARKALLDAGFTDVANVKEGVQGGPNGPGWIARGLPLQ